MIDMDRAQLLGDRHLRPDLDGKLGPLDSSSQRAVRIVASPEVAVTAGGQHTLWMLVNLLARQFAVIHELVIEVPAAPLEPGVALFGEAPDLVTTLVRTAELVAGTAMRVTPAGQQPACGVAAEVLVGQTPGGGEGPFRIGALGSGWSAFAGGPERMPAILPAGRNPLGPYFAACLAAGEVFKGLRGLRPGKGRFLDSFLFSLWDFEERPSWEELPAGEWPLPFCVPPFYLVGAGAVGQAVAAALAGSGEVRGHATPIDGERIDLHNLNRYPLVGQGHIGQAKSELTAEILRRAGLEAYPYQGRWQDYVADAARPPQRADVRALEAAYRFPLVLSCVDRNGARHAIQNFWPEYLLGGSTSGLALEVTAYDMRSPYECLKCSNPLEPAGLTVEEITDGLRQLAPEERRARAEARGADWRAVEEYLANPRCGHLGEAEIARFRFDAVDWSVGFVSVAAGTFLGAQLLRYTLLGREAFPEARGNSLRFSFLNLGARWTRHRRRPECDCGGRGRTDYDALWPEGVRNQGRE